MLESAIGIIAIFTLITIFTQFEMVYLAEKIGTLTNRVNSLQARLNITDEAFGILKKDFKQLKKDFTECMDKASERIEELQAYCGLEEDSEC